MLGYLYERVPLSLIFGGQAERCENQVDGLAGFALVSLQGDDGEGVCAGDCGGIAESEFYEHESHGSHGLLG